MEADRYISAEGIPALQDPRVRLDFNDARNTLLVEPTSYDLIVAQPSHPWLAGAANVFTQQFWEIAKSRLNEKGVFGQWVNLFKMDATTLRSLFQAFYRVFPNGMSFANLNTGDLVLIGSNKPLTFDFKHLTQILEQPKIRATLGTHKIFTPADLLWYFALSRDEAIAAAGNARPNTDTNIISEVRLSALTSQPTGKEDPYAFLIKNFHLDLIPYLGSNAADLLYAQADRFFALNDLSLAAKAGLQLSKIDPLRGRAVTFEHAYRTKKFVQAAALYAQYQEWPDRTHALYAKMLAQQGHLIETPKSLLKIKNSEAKHAAFTALLILPKK